MKKVASLFWIYRELSIRDFEKSFPRIFYFGKEAGHELFHFGGFIDEYILDT